MEFTSKSVAGNFGDMCDQIVDAIMCDIQKKNKKARAVCNAFATKGAIIITGEVSEEALNDVDIDHIVRRTIRENGYSDGPFGLDADGIAVINLMKLSD